MQVVCKLLGAPEPPWWQNMMEYIWQVRGWGVIREEEGEKRQREHCKLIICTGDSGKGWKGEMSSGLGAKLNRLPEHRMWSQGTFFSLQWRGGMALRKHSNGNQQDLVLIFTFCLNACLFSLYVWSSPKLTLQRWTWLYPNTTLHTFVSIPELFCCTCEQAEKEKGRKRVILVI